MNVKPSSGGTYYVEPVDAGVYTETLSIAALPDAGIGCAVIGGEVRYLPFRGVSDTRGNVDCTDLSKGLVRSIRFVAKQAQSYYAGTAYEDTVNAPAAD